MSAIGQAFIDITLTPDSNGNLKSADAVLAQLMAQNVAAQNVAAQGTGTMRGFTPRASCDRVVDDRPQSFVLGGYRFTGEDAVSLPTAKAAISP